MYVCLCARVLRSVTTEQKCSKRKSHPYHILVIAISLNYKNNFDTVKPH